MVRWRTALAPALVLAALMSTPAGCDNDNPDPECAPNRYSYRVCSDNTVWECPRGTPEQVAEKEKKEAQCDDAPDRIKCLLDIEHEMVPMRKIMECGPGGTRCVSDPMATPSSASCETDADGGAG